MKYPFMRVVDGVFRCPLPGARELDEFRGRGGASVVDLTQRPRPVVEHHCRRLGLSYHKHPLPYEGGDTELAADLVLSLPRPVLFHCYHGRDRSGRVARAILHRLRIGVAAIVLINEKNDRTFTRIYRLAAFFDVPQLFALDCPADTRGNVYSAKGRVEVVRRSVSEFTALQSALGFRYIVCDPFVGEPTAQHVSCSPLAVLLNRNRRGTPRALTDAMVCRFHVPQLGSAPELYTDQAAALALYSVTS